jgi:hypothetical protein
MVLVRPADWNNTDSRISDHKDWNHLHQASKAQTQMEASNSSTMRERNLNDGRKSTDMNQRKNPVEEGWKFLQNAKELTSHQTLASHTKKGTNRNRTPTCE